MKRMVSRGLDRSGWPSLGLVGLVLLGLISTQCLAESSAPGSSPALIKASGEARVMAEADRVQVDLAVVSRAPDAELAVAQNAKTSQSVEAALRKSLGPSASIESSGYALSPNYLYVKGKGQELDGYLVRNRLRISLDDISAAGRIVDSASRAGASEIGQVQFVLKDDSKYRKQALEQATQNAMQRAGIMATALSLRVVRVLSVYEGQAPISSNRQRAEVFKMSDGAASVPTSILPGGVEIRASATVEVEVAP